MKKLAWILFALGTAAVLIGCGDADEAARKAAVEGDGYDQSAVEEDPNAGSAGAGTSPAPADPPGATSTDSSGEEEED